ncbi:hypothetical protein BD847_2725 [Flavobacterium cutihirudinis]|uniref:Cadherin domain-containing protein n=1 Tax=Flavobacterium cutihirudinis TaxID=1265740 RepID=A0A3D9FSR0_9FLAO|nr:T9SS type A sorting domain-containing protein [Flavobacterium cutihirudinis]RED23662.1 hypothetical protein BD847_2725 [Flavobacterium cutihirudinis]
MKKYTNKMLLFFLFFFSVFFTNAQDVTISGSCFIGTQTFVKGGNSSIPTYNSKPAYYNANVSITYQSTPISAEAYLVFIPAVELGLPEDRWVILLDGQPYFYAISSAATAPTSNYLPFDETATTTDCGGTPVIAPPNQAPTDISLTNAFINENVPALSSVGLFTTTDPDLGGTFTYSLVGGAGSTDNAYFSIIGNELRINSSPNYEIKSFYTIRVRTTDQGGASFEKSFVISIINVCDIILSKVENNATCPGRADGSATITAIEGTGPYNYQWPNGETSATVNNLAVGTYTVTVRDTNGCFAYIAVTIGANQDLAPPVPTLPGLPDVREQCSVVAGRITAPTAIDNCAGLITATTLSPLTYSAQGNYTIFWQFNDGNGNITFQNQNVIVDDTTDPVPDVANLLPIVSECGVTVTAPTATDNCVGMITGTTIDPTSFSSQGSYMINWTYSDGNGNASTQTQNVIVDDITAPVPDAATLLDIVSECAVTVTAPTATDNCKGIITATALDPTSYSAEGSYVINWVYDDGNGNTSTQTQNVTVDDITAPVANVTNLPNIVSQCQIILGTIIAPTATDNCKGLITATTTSPLSYSTQGNYTINWTYNDGNGNISTQTQNVIVDDTTLPVPDATVLSALVAECEIPAGTIAAPTAIDNCGGIIIATTTDPLTYSVQGEYTIHWIFDDGHGNTLTQTQDVIIRDTTAPFISFPTLLDVISECGVTVTAPTTTDNCAGIITATTLDPTSYSAEGNYVINWTYDDGNGNTSTQIQNVTIDDVTAPVADVPNLLGIVSECGVTVTAPTATDNCKGVITATTLDPTSYAAEGSYVINWTYDDGNGNTSTQTQNVTIDDITAPVPDVATLLDVVSQCGVTVTAPTATDNCKGVIAGTTTSPLTYSTQGNHTITWTYDDGNGNVSTQTQNVIVKDNVAPVADIAVLSDVLGQCSATVTTVPTATDNCGGIITGLTSDALTYSTQGNFTITWTYDDGNGNVTTQTQNVIVKDNVAPVADIAVLSDVLGQCSATVTAVPTATDNCGGIITGATSDALTYSTQGNHTITWTYDDGNGNVTTQTQNVIVKDNVAPVADIAVLSDVLGQCSATVTTVPTATDNCGGIITGATSDALTYSTQGNYTITWTYDDGNGNVTTQTQNVIVKDNVAPVADIAVLSDVLGQCEVVVTAPTATDNCGGTIVGSTTSPLTYSTQGNYTITWTYDDGNGNVSTQTQNVIVKDNVAPVANVTKLADIVATCGISAGTIVAPTATDNCAGTITGTTTDPLVYSAQGNYTITWTYDDGNGNTSTQQQLVQVSASGLESVTFSDASYTYDGKSHVLEVENLPVGATVTYANSATTGTENGGINAGNYAITATVSSSFGNCTPVVLSAKLEIKKATQQITFDALPEKILGDNSFNLNAVTTSGLPLNYSFTYNSALPPANVSADGLVNLLREGEIVITAHQDGDDNYLPAENVTQRLIIKANKNNDATISEITIGGQVYKNPSQEINYLMECGEENVAISISNDANASILPSENFIVDIPKAGIYKQNVSVTSEDGSTTSNYVVNIQRPFKFDDIVRQKFNNVLLVNNNPQTNGGYEFVSYEWFKNGQLVGTGQYYSAGDNVNDALDPSAEYSVKMKTKDGQILQTCNSRVSTQKSLSAKLYPNPIQIGKVITIETDFPSEELEKMQINLYTVTGQLIKTVKSSSALTEIQLPIADSTMYLVVIETPNIKKTLKVIVNK